MNCSNCDKEVFLEWNVCPHCGCLLKKDYDAKYNSGWLHQEPKFNQKLGKFLESCPVSKEYEETSENRSIMKLYPELNLVPATLVRRTGLAWWWILYIFVSLALLFSLLVGVFLTIDVHVAAGIPVIIAGIILLILWNRLFYKREIWCHPHGGHKNLIKEADYVSGKRGLCIFVKNNCFGLFKMWSLKVFVPPIYNYMKWESYKRYLRVKKDGREFLIDIYNNEI